MKAKMRNKSRSTAWALTNGTCFYCGTSLVPDDELDRIIFADPQGIDSRTYEELKAKELNLDHRHPRSRGGSSRDENYVPSCRACNVEKGARDIEEYRIWLMLNVSRPPVPFYGECAATPRDWLLVASPDRRRGGEHLRPYCGAAATR